MMMESFVFYNTFAGQEKQIIIQEALLQTIYLIHDSLTIINKSNTSTNTFSILSVCETRQ